MKMPPIIPDRWIPYKACGDIIEGTRIICFKVPLRRMVQLKEVARKDIWDIEALLKRIPKLAAVIDLTNTARYYDPEDLKSAGIQHKKLLMPGRIIPPEDKVAQFTNAVELFLKTDEDTLIGVHCTHGLNRTGYMVCRYMRDKLGIPAEEAIKRFETARGYKMERANYIADLLRKTPPPPDVGKDTIVKPIMNSHNVEYCSQLNVYEDEVSDSRKKRRNHSSYKSDEENDSCSKYKRDNLSIKVSKGKGSKSPETTPYRFDFRYDY